jgi:hypothetical protein
VYDPALNGSALQDVFPTSFLSNADGDVVFKRVVRTPGNIFARYELVVMERRALP